MAPHSSTLSWKIPWVEEPGRLQSMGLRRVRHDWATSLSLSCIGEGNGNPLQCSCLKNPRDGGAWWAAMYGVSLSWTQLKRLSSNSSSRYNTTISDQINISWSNTWYYRVPHEALRSSSFYSNPHNNTNNLSVALTVQFLRKHLSFSLTSEN